MTELAKYPVRVRRSSWHDRDTGTTSPTLQVCWRDIFINIPFESARQIVDEIHDMCDDFENEQRERNAQ